ncbi:UTP--glucose-1-phosphate uridylyltransferase [Afipia felis]|uniref:UTP--glucose-1-phosphate uridylyltransferase n=1 Tax=Afipia felis TaxID=1035 RepID=A0A090MKV7_AFIFE|nr:UTP--glucose-1-phosphate uridylyltransferase [Afipia felis]
MWCAREIVGNEPFAVLLPDVLVKNKPSGLKQMIDAANAAGADKANIIAVEEVPMEHVHMYGVVGVGPSKGDLFELNGMVEKPKKEVAPSNLSITGRYILQPEIFNILETQERGAGGEIQLTDAMLTLAGRQPFYGFKFKGKSYDCGSKSGFLAANIAYAMDREDLRGDLLSEMKKYV